MTERHFLLYFTRRLRYRGKLFFTPPLMTNASAGSDAPGSPRSITIGLIASWGFGILFALAAIASFLDAAFISALIMAILAATVLPPVNRLMQKELNVSLSRGLKILIVIAGLILAGVFANAAEPIGNPDRAGNPAREPDETPVSITARELFRAYDTNAIAADDRYKGKLLEVSGTVESIGKDILDAPYVTLSTDAVIFSVQCMLSRSDTTTAARLSPGQSITVIGRNSGKMGNIILRDCSIRE